MATLNLDMFSDSSRRILEGAQKLAQKRRHRYIEPVHVLIGILMSSRDSSGADLLRAAGANTDTMLAELNRELGNIPKAYRSLDQVFLAEDLVKAVNSSRELARRDGLSEVSPAVLVLAIAGLQKGPAGRLLRQQGATAEALHQKMRAGGSSSDTASRVRRAGRDSANDGPLNIEVLSKFGEDMTAKAERDEFDPVVGREAELRRIMQVLCRRTKNNPVLIGEPGVGKTAIVEALCQRIVAGDVPLGLKGRRIFSITMADLRAGTSLRGQFEERISKILTEIKESNGRVIVYIDEIHSIVASGGEGNDTASILKPALARGDLRCIGTTTAAEYKQYIEKDLALVRRFQEIAVAEPSIDQAVAILRGIKQKYEIHHGVRITDASIIAAVKFADRYLTDRKLPDTAIDLIDEAASRLRLEIDSKPNEIDSLERRIASMKIERDAIANEQTADAAEARQRLDGEIDALSGKVGELDSHWRREKELLDRITHLQEELEATDKSLEKARREGDLGRASELERYVRPSIERDIEAQAQALSEIQVDVRLLKQDVEVNDIGEVVAAITGIPVTKMMEGDIEKLLKMEERLQQRVVGQDEAIAAIATAVRRSRAGVSDPNRPIGNFFFVGPTGVGKTELAKALAVFLFDTEDALIRIDMSEYQEQAKVNTLIGSARGYVGSEKGGVLTEAIRRKPYSVVLFDETEKAHPKVFDLLLQVMDEGRLTDSDGIEVDFTNTIVIMTSNAGSRQILDMAGKLTNDEMTAQVHQILRQHNSFRPEFLARIDDIVVFQALNMDAMDLILEIQLRRLNKILAEQKLTLKLTEQAKEWVAEEGFEPEYGARPLKRAVLNHIQDPLATLILDSTFAPGDSIMVDVAEDDSALTFVHEADFTGPAIRKTFDDSEDEGEEEADVATEAPTNGAVAAEEAPSEGVAPPPSDGDEAGDEVRD